MYPIKYDTVNKTALLDTVTVWIDWNIITGIQEVEQV